MSDVAESDRLTGCPHPRARDVLIGHCGAETELLRAVAAEKLAHGWIFAGPRGIGKATLAYRFARFLLSHGEDVHRRAGTAGSLEVDPQHPVFQQVAAQAHPDLFVLRRAWDHKAKRLRAELRAEEVREAAHFFARTSGAGGYRICIVDTADDMNRTAANALLKVLEEPPERSLFVLISNTPGRLLATIRSRSRLLRLAPLDVADTLAGLRQLAGDDITDENLIACSRLAAGSLGHGLTLLRGDGLKLYGQMLDLLSGLPKLERGQLLKVAGNLSSPRAREEYRLFCAMLGDWLARATRGAATGDLVDFDIPESGLVERLGFIEKPHIWATCWQDIAEGMRQAEIFNLDRRQVIVNAFLDLEEAARRSGARAA